MNKLAKIIKELSLEELQFLKKDLDAGNIEKLLLNRIKEEKSNKLVQCPVCSTPVKEGTGWHLNFGPPSLRKKATFDGPDCLQYFLQHIKKR